MFEEAGRPEAVPWDQESEIIQLTEKWMKRALVLFTGTFTAKGKVYLAVVQLRGGVEKLPEDPSDPSFQRDKVTNNSAALNSGI